MQTSRQETRNAKVDVLGSVVLAVADEIPGVFTSTQDVSSREFGTSMTSFLQLRFPAETALTHTCSPACNL